MTTAVPLLPTPRSAAAVAVPVPPPPVDVTVRRIRRLFWLFIALWLVEGALRKWVLPDLANPLLVVRDPVLLLIYFFAFGRKGLFPLNPFVLVLFAVGGLAAVVALVATHTPPVVVAFGFRANFLHLPLIFLVPRVLDRNDVLRVGRCLLVVAGPMAVVVFAQFVAPRGSWLNAGAGGGLDGQMESAMGHVRASGTFSFTNGLVGFAALVSAFVLYWLLFPRVYPKTLWLLGGGSLVVMTTLSGNRSLVGVLGLTVAALMVAGFVRPRFLAASWKVLAVGALVVLALGSFAVFRQGLDVFAYRFGDEETVKTGFVGRYFAGINVAPWVWQRAKVEGLGLGMGTNAGAALLTGGKRDMMLAEGEWDRMVLELGPPLGIVYLTLRGLLTLHLLRQAWAGLRRGGDPLALLLAAGCYSDVLVGQLTQPTALGFVCIAGGLTLAATRAPGEGTATVENVAGEKRPPAAPRRRGAVIPAPIAPAAPVAVRRGRSAYAERLHGAGSDGKG